jgi:hypothetical protein
MDFLKHIVPISLSSRLFLKMNKYRGTSLASAGDPSTLLANPNASSVPVWIYVIFRKNPSSGHDKMMVEVSSDGPVFWDRHVIYCFCCSCHFEKHERELTQLLEKFRGKIERVCLVDNPVDYAFLPDSFFSYMANALSKLTFVYLRELDLEKINRATVEKLSKHPRLKKLVVHGCRNYEALQDFHNLPQLLVVKGDIVGLKAMLGDLADYEPAVSSKSTSSSADSAGRSVQHSSSPLSLSSQLGPGSSRLSSVDAGHEEHKSMRTPSPSVAVRD